MGKDTGLVEFLKRKGTGLKKTNRATNHPLREVSVSTATCPGLGEWEMRRHHGNHIPETHWYWSLSALADVVVGMRVHLQSSWGGGEK